MRQDTSRRADTQRERVNRGYLSRVLRLTPLAPELLEAILDVRQPEEVILPALIKPFPVGWEQQRAYTGLIT